MNLIPIKQETINGFNNIEMTISWGGYAELDKQWKHNNVCSSFSRVYFIKDGEGILKYGDCEIKMKSGYAYLIPIGFKFSYECDEKMTQIFFHINMHKGVNGDLLRCCGKIKEVYVGKEMICAAERTVLSETYCDIINAKNILYKCIAMCLDDENTESLMPHHSSFIDDVLKYINANLSMKLKSEEIAEHFMVSGSTLYRKFKKEMGITLHNYIEDSVFYWAERMIVEERYSISQISEMVGFCDQFYFSKRFMERFGHSPAQYRKIHL